MTDELSPIASQYDSDPWVPNIDPSSSDQSDQKKAAQSYEDVVGRAQRRHPLHEQERVLKDPQSLGRRGRVAVVGILRRRDPVDVFVALGRLLLVALIA